MELVELHVRHPTTCAPRHGNAVTGSAVGVAGVQVRLAGAAGGKNHRAGAESIDFAAGAVEHIGAEAAIAVAQIQLALGDQVNGYFVLKQGNVAALARAVEQSTKDRRASGIGGVNNAPMAVAAFAG